MLATFQTSNCHQFENLQVAARLNWSLAIAPQEDVT